MHQSYPARVRPNSFTAEVVNALSLVAPISILTAVEIPLCKWKQPHCQEPKCSTHDVQTYWEGLLEGYSKQTEPWLENILTSLPANESINK